MSPFSVFAHSLFVFRFIAGFIRIAVSYVSPHCSLCCHSLLNFDLSFFFLAYIFAEVYLSPCGVSGFIVLFLFVLKTLE